MNGTENLHNHQTIIATVINVAVGKAAMQSSTVGNTKEEGAAQRAIDGSTSTFFNGNSCTMTEPDRNNWWYVNLLEPYLVQLVRIDFGTSCCSNNRPATVTVRVGNNRPDLGVNPICNKFTGFIEEGRPLFLPCARPMPGTFVSVHLESPGNPLSICEAFVYTDRALSIEQCPSFRDQPLGSTSTYNGKCYIFYNNQPMTFDNAKRFCEIRGGSLVDETSPSLQGFLSWEIYRRHKNDPNGQVCFFVSLIYNKLVFHHNALSVLLMVWYPVLWSWVKKTVKLFVSLVIFCQWSFMSYVFSSALFL